MSTTTSDVDVQPVRRSGIERLLHPESVAIIGASPNPGKIGGKVGRNALAFGFPGQVFLVNPNYERIGSTPCYPDMGVLPAQVDVAVVCLPGDAVIPAVTACGEAGVGAVVVLSAGFAETGTKGSRMQQELVGVAAATGMRVLGPNCLGLLNVKRALALSFSSVFEARLPPPGPLAVVAQSGALAASLLTMIREAELGLGWWVTTGNEADINWLEVAEALLAEDDVRQLAIYAEGMHDGGRLLDLGARALDLGKQVILLSAGTSQEAADAVQSHSGSLASPAVLIRGLMTQGGILEAEDLPALVEASLVFRHGRNWHGGSVGILTTSGGAGIMLVDACAMRRLPVAVLRADTRRRLATALPEFAATANPVDVTGAAMYCLGMLREPFRAVVEDPNVGAVTILLTLVTGETAVALAKDIVDLARATDKPVLVAWLAGDMAQDAYAVLRAAHIPLFFSLRACAGALEKIWRYEYRRREAYRHNLALSATDPAQGFAGVVTETPAKKLLHRYGIRVPAGTRARSLRAAEGAATHLGYPLVVKSEAPNLLHRTQVGAVRLGLQSKAALRRVCREISDLAGDPTMRIEHMVKAEGLEFLVGGRFDPALGPFVLLGLGGRSAELINDIVARRAPITPQEVERMIDELHAGLRIRAWLDEGPASVALCQAVAQISCLIADIGPRLAELDVNPLLVSSDGDVIALDALLILQH